MAVFLSPVGNDAPFVDTSGNPYSGARLFFYTAGSSTKVNAYTTSAGNVAISNPVTLNSQGFPAVSGNVVGIWLTGGTSYDIGLAAPGSDDPPASFLRLYEDVSGINDASVSIDQWVSGPTPTFISATSFSLAGDQTSTFHVGRRLKSTNSGGTIYSRITDSVFGALTTVTVENDSGTLDSGLSAVSYGLLSRTNPAIPAQNDDQMIVVDPSDPTKRARLDAGSVTAASTRVMHAGDFDQFVGANYQEMNCRLTLTSGTPVTTGDVTAAETVYLTPFRGNRVWLWNTTLSLWQPFALSEISVDVPDATQMNDVFLYNNAGTLTLEVVAWTNDTTRATALTTQNGILVKTGELNKRYVGSFYSTTAGNGQTEDSLAKRYVWNYYNRQRRMMANALETANTWNYTLATYQQANANAANQLDMVIGVSEDIVEATVLGAVANSSGAYANVGIGVDSTTVNSARNVIGHTVTGSINSTHASYQGYPGIGKHILTWIEQSVASGTTTWYGDNNAATTTQTGIRGSLLG